MLGNMAKEFFAASPLMLLPVIALLLFLCAFTVITVRALRRKPAELESIARLPLAEDGADPSREDDRE